MVSSYHYSSRMTSNYEQSLNEISKNYQTNPVFKGLNLVASILDMNL